MNTAVKAGNTLYLSKGKQYEINFGAGEKNKSAAKYTPLNSS